MTALSQAIRNKHWRQARLLIEAGSDINRRCQPDKRTPLMELCFLDDEDKALGLAKMLLENGADLGFQDTKGLNALSYACILKRKKLVKLFLRFVDYNLNAVDRDANTALFHAISVGELSIVMMLVKKLKYYDLSVDTQNLKGETPLILALKIGNTEAAELLIQRGKASQEICDFEHFKTAAQWKKEIHRKENRIISPFYRVENKQKQEKPSRKVRKTVSAKPINVCTFPKLDESKKQISKGRPFTAPGIIQVSDFFTSCTPVQEELLQLYGIYNQQTTSSYRKGYKFTPRAAETNLPPLEEEVAIEVEVSAVEAPSEQERAKMNFAQVNELNSKIKGLQKTIRNRKNSSSPANSDGSAQSGKKKIAKLLRKAESKSAMVTETSISNGKN